MSEPLKIGIVAGEVSGDLLGEDLIAALKHIHDGPVELVGVGGDGLAAQGLVSLFDYSELSIMGFTEVAKKIPLLLRRIRQTADALIAAKPDLLLIIDSPDYCHRVAKRVRMALPNLPVVNYVCPSVWAWKEYRARDMLAYIDHVLAVLPFEPEVMKRLGGPETTYVGHRLTEVPGVLEARANAVPRPVGRTPTILLLPGSRSGEIKSLAPLFKDVAVQFASRNGAVHFLMPTVRHRVSLVRDSIADWPIKPEIIVGDTGKWEAFAKADAAIAASGTVVLELALSGIPVISTYKADFFGKFMLKKIKIWSASLPNLIADTPLVPEYFNETIRAGALVRWLEKLCTDTPQRKVMTDGFDQVWRLMQTETPPGERAAGIVLEILRRQPKI